MKKQFICLILITVLISGAFQNVSSRSINENSNISISSKTISFSQASLEMQDEYISINLDETSSYISTAGEPMLPVFTKKFSYPLGTKILDVICKPQKITDKIIEGKIKPAPELRTKISIGNIPESNNEFESKEIYCSTDSYPSSWYSYKITCGIENGRNSVILTIRLYPVRYSPANNIISQTEGFDLEINYDYSNVIGSSPDEYDMVIIAPRKFSRILQPLIDHKNDFGVKTFLKTTESIYRRPFFGGYEGRDDAEKVKYFIKDAIETYGIKYVLLFGGRVGQFYRWNVPVRYSNLDDWASWEESFLSDLYFADIYRYNDTSDNFEFEDWDSDGDGIFAEWYRNVSSPDDELDLCPDVYVGRLACRNFKEAKLVVEKIIDYEKNTFNKEWFKKIVLVGGDTFNDLNTSKPHYDYYEGEIETRLGADYIEPLGFNSTEIFASTESFTSSDDIINALNNGGAGFAFFSGHSNPLMFSTHPPNAELWIDFYNFEMKLLNNSEKLPVCVVGGCHSSQFDVTVFNFFTGLLKEKLKYFNETGDAYGEGGFGKVEWANRCWSWNLVVQENGGSIATIGNTGLGFGNSGPACTEFCDGWITTHFFEVYHNLTLTGNNTLGEIHTKTVMDYVEKFNVNGDRIDGKTAQQWVLLGDPSLKIGGYPPII